MADEKKKVTKKTVNDPWLSISGVRKEAKRVRWPKWKSDGNNTGILENTEQVIIFTGFFAAYFVLCDLVITFLLKAVGIGV